MPSLGGMETDPPAGSDPNQPLQPRHPAQPSQTPPTPPVESAKHVPPPPALDAKPTSGPGSAAGQGSGTASAAWYNGPLPIAALNPARETTGAAIGRTAIKAITALVVFAVGLLAIPFFFIFIGAVLGAAGGGAV